MDRQYFMCDLWKGARRDTFAISVALHGVCLAIVVALAGKSIVSVKKPDVSQSVTLVSPTPLQVTKASPPAPKIVAPPVRVPAVAIRKPELRLPAQAPKLKPEVAEARIPVPPVTSPLPVVRQEAKPAGFDPPKTSAATTTKPKSEVQTGGFGDPNGMPGQGRPNAALTTATLGSFDLPAGSGAGNGSGGSKGVRGTVASAGFGSGVSGSTPGPSRSQRGVVQAGFTDETVVADAPARSRPASPRMTPVEILSKPRPVYTPEARSLRIQGEVLLDVVFLASGGLRVSRVVAGLGHGLDDAAMQAAQRIRFKPATQDGQPCDSNATVHIVFQLAE